MIFCNRNKDRLVLEKRCVFVYLFWYSRFGICGAVNLVFVSLVVFLYRNYYFGLIFGDYVYLFFILFRIYNCLIFRNFME